MKMIASLPVWFCVVITVACLLLNEFYPFSNFPMYSKNAPSAFCLYVTGADDKVLYTMPEFEKFSSVLKKMFNGKIQKYKEDGLIKRYNEMTEEQFQAVGAEILQWLLSERKRLNKPPLNGNIRLMHEEFVLKKGKPVKKTFKIAEIPTTGGP